MRKQGNAFHCKKHLGLSGKCFSLHSMAHVPSDMLLIYPCYEIDVVCCPGKMPSTVQDVLVSAIRLLRGKAAPECHNAVAAKPVEDLLRVLGMRQMGSSIWAAVPDEQAVVNASNSFSAATVVFAAQTGSYMYNLHTATSDKDFKVSWRLVDWNQHQLGCRLCIIPLQQSLHHSVGGGLRSGSSSMLLLL